MPDVEGATFRANPSYELIEFDYLSGDELAHIRKNADVGNIYGVLRPRPGSSVRLHSASIDTALLLLTLTTAGPIPAYFRRNRGSEYQAIISKLVLDEVLEIEHEGAFVTGVVALDKVFLEHRTERGGSLAKLSVAALQYAQALEGLTANELAWRLYFYGRKPASGLRRRGLVNDEAIREFLGQIGDTNASSVLSANWNEAPYREDRPYWRMWHPRRGSPGSQMARYKLYFSFGWAFLPDVFLAVAESLCSAPGARGFKVARDVASLARTDNLVAYFARLEDLSEFAAHLSDRFADYESRGVPFTAEITSNGSMSWGIDPPALAFVSTSSWRLSVVDRLASYLLAAKAAGDREPWQFALERLRLDGVDTDTWVPTSKSWVRSAKLH